MPRLLGWSDDRVRARVTDGGRIEIDNEAARDYILLLNDGWSPQAAAGFIDRCVEEAKARVLPLVSGRVSARRP